MQTVRNLVIVALIIAAFSSTNAFSQGYDLSLWYGFKNHKVPTTAPWVNRYSPTINIDCRAEFDQAGTISLLVTRTIKLGKFELSPGAGVMIGDYKGTLIECYLIRPSQTGITVFTMAEYGSVSSEQLDFYYQYGELKKKLTPWLSALVAGQIYTDINQRPLQVAYHNLEIGPCICLNYGKAYIKPWVTTSLVRSNDVVLRVGVGLSN